MIFKQNVKNKPIRTHSSYLTEITLVFDEHIYQFNTVFQIVDFEGIVEIPMNYLQYDDHKLKIIGYRDFYVENGITYNNVKVLHCGKLAITNIEKYLKKYRKGPYFLAEFLNNTWTGINKNPFDVYNNILIMPRDPFVVNYFLQRYGLASTSDPCSYMGSSRRTLKFDKIRFEFNLWNCYVKRRHQYWSAIKIKNFLLHCIYRPSGLGMKRCEQHFYSLIK